MKRVRLKFYRSQSDEGRITVAWEEIYQKKLSTAVEISQYVKSGDHIVFQGSGCVPWGFLNVLLKRKDELNDVYFCHPSAWGDFPYGKSEYKGHFRYKSFFLSANARKAWEKRWGIDIIPVRLSAISELFLKEIVPVDMAVLNLSPPDAKGFCSMGPYAVYMNSAIQKAKLVVGQVNKYMPRTQGDTLIHVEELDFIFEKDEPLLEIPPVEAGEVETKIAKHVEPFIQDGDTLQIGRGGVPQAIINMLEEKRDLGVHSELISDWVVDLVEKGVITGARKTHLPGKIVATIGDGTKRLFDFVNDNDSVLFKSADYVNDPRIIAQNDNFVSINGAVQVDLTGQINAESIGTRPISGVGGQLDFALGAQWAKNGRYIVAMPSTALNGKNSRIVPFFSEGTVVTIPRTLADVIVTEYGVAELKGKTLEERAKSLINIAHPKFRDSLMESASKFLCM